MERSPECQAKLPDPESLTYLKPGYENVNLAFPVWMVSLYHPPIPGLPEKY